MNILAHRGYWIDKKEKNSLSAIERALENGYGFESDVRDYCGELVISHNVANEECIGVEKIFSLLEKYKNKNCFAINIKSDGLSSFLLEYLKRFNISNYFVFDMSVPQMLEYKKSGLRLFTRQSEFESNPCLYNECAGVWIDSFKTTDWITEKLLQKHLNKGKYICIVSPELHGRLNYLEFWRRLKKYYINWEKIFLCTDFPEEAKEYFHD